MKNVNDILTQEYFTLLKTAVTPVPVFRDGYVPKDLVEDAYVMVSAINNTDNSSMQSHDTITSVQVGIYTRSNTDNNATVINDLADKVYTTIMPAPINALFVNGFQVLTTELGNDTSPAPLDTGSQLFINRFITFNHKIVHQ